LDQPRACGGLGKRRQVSAEADRARPAAASGYQEQKCATERERETLPLVAAEYPPGNNRAQKHTLAQHPKPAALQKVAVHSCHISQISMAVSLVYHAPSLHLPLLRPSGRSGNLQSLWAS